MTFLRSAMLAAGVPQALVYRKFVSNDHLLVTALESKMIAEKLSVWLRGRSLTLDLAESDPRSRVAAKALLFVQKAVGNEDEAARLARKRRAESLPFRMDRKARIAIRAFAGFCGGSGGFYVD
jgi:hypothetical protein